MIVDGKSLAEEIAREVGGEITKRALNLTLGVVVMSDSPVTARYLERKQKMADKIGVAFNMVSISPEQGTAEVQSAVKALAAKEGVSGLLVQLPLPSHVDTAAVLNMIPAGRDPDVLSLESRKRFETGAGILPPVIAAMKEIIDRNGVALSGARAVVVGHGNLVGKPACAWLRNEGAEVISIDEHTENPTVFLREADVVVCGAGVPGLIQPEMLKEGVVLLDAGTTDIGGSLKGDADPACAEKCSIFTPVPGGIGPLTIVMIYKNLLSLRG